MKTKQNLKPILSKKLVSEKEWRSLWSHYPLFSESTLKTKDNRLKGSIIFSKDVSIPTTYCGNNFTTCSCLSEKELEIHVEEMKKEMKKALNKILKQHDKLFVKKIIETHHKNKDTITVEYTLIIEGDFNEFKKSKLIK